MIKLVSLRCYPLLGNDHIYVCNDTHSAMHQWCFISKVFPRLPNCHHKIPPLWRQKLDFLLAGGNLELFQRLQMESQNVVKNAAWTLDLAHDSMVFHRKLIWKSRAPAWLVLQIQFVHAYTLDVLQALARMGPRWTQPVSIQDRPLDFLISWNSEMAHFTTSQADWK